MFPILFRVGSYVVYSYTVALVIGMIVGLLLASHLARRRGIPAGTLLDAGFWALLGGILGGRIGYVAANWAYYVDHLDKAAALREGGLSWHGALLGGCAAFVIWSSLRSQRTPGWRDLLDAIAPSLALGGAMGWLGCLLTGCAYGAEATGYAPPMAWLTAELPDIFGVNDVRFLTQPLMIAWCLLLSLLLWGTYRRLPPGLTFALYLFLYALADGSIAFLRGDGTWRWGLWLSQWAALAEASAGLALGIALFARRRSAPGTASGGQDQADLPQAE
jgi:phosphatidylglycerol:prolipoprotein diacylglycerol transferase